VASVAPGSTCRLLRSWSLDSRGRGQIGIGSVYDGRSAASSLATMATMATTAIEATLTFQCREGPSVQPVSLDVDA
jgi:hypothetical protein